MQKNKKNSKIDALLSTMSERINFYVESFEDFEAEHLKALMKSDFLEFAARYSAIFIGARL